MQNKPRKSKDNNFMDKTGEMRYVEVKAKKIDVAGQAADLVIFRDIIRRKENARRLKEYSEKMEDTLKQERDMLEAVTENIGAGLAVISEDYHILWANKLLKQINGDCEGKLCYSTFNRLTDVCPDCGVKKVF